MKLPDLVDFYKIRAIIKKTEKGGFLEKVYKNRNRIISRQ
jgi:hypothetical protein